MDRPKRSWEVDWEGACTLDECILKMLLEGKGKTPEFKKMMEVWTRERVERIWAEHQAKKEREKNGNPGGDKSECRGAASKMLRSVLFPAGRGTGSVSPDADQLDREGVGQPDLLPAFSEAFQMGDCHA